MIVATVSGAESVARGLGTVAAQLGDLSDAFDELGVAMLDEAEPLTPVLSGVLVDSLTVDATGEGLTFSSDLVYAGVQSYGWPARNIEPAGFAQAAEGVADQEAADHVDTLLERTVRAAGLAP